MGIINTNTRRPKRNWWKEYTEYLKSPEWDMVRSLCLARDGERCTKCPSTDRLQAHHIRYPKSVWDTTVQDLTTLCFDCHKEHHEAKGKIKIITWEEHLSTMVVFPLRPDQLLILRSIRKMTRNPRLIHRASKIAKRHHRILSSANKTDQTTAPIPERPRDVHAKSASGQEPVQPGTNPDPTLTEPEEINKAPCCPGNNHPGETPAPCSHTPSIFAAPTASLEHSSTRGTTPEPNHRPN